MTRKASITILCLATFITALRAESPTTTPATQPTTAPAPTLATALADALAAKQLPRDLVITARWGGKDAATLYGDGVGIWRNDTQFTLRKEQLVDVLKLLQKEKFPDMPTEFGKSAPTKGGISVNTVVGEVSLNIGGVSRRIIQLDGPEKSPELARIAEKILAVCKPAAATGVTITDYRDGLQKLARGSLSPVTMHVILYRAGDGDAKGYLLKIDGANAEYKTMSKKGPGPAQRETLTPQELLAISKLLAEAKADEFPATVYAPTHIDLNVGVLNKSKQVLGRKDAAGIGPKTLGAKQTNFDRIITTFEELIRKKFPLQDPPAP